MTFPIKAAQFHKATHVRIADLFLKWELSIQSPSLAYAAKGVIKNAFFTLDIPYPLLKA